MLMDVATPTKVGCSSWEIANVALKKEDSTVRFTTTMYSLFGNFSWRIDGESSLFGSGHSLFCGVVQTPLREEEGHDYWSKWICGSSHCSAAHPQRHDMPDHWISFGVGQQIAERRRCEPIESQIVRLCHFNAGHCSEGERWMAEASVHCDWHRSYVLCHGDWRYESVIKISLCTDDIEGSVDLTDCCNVASNITPVPGGTGMLSSVMLMQNTMKSMVLQEGMLPLYERMGGQLSFYESLLH